MRKNLQTPFQTRQHMLSEDYELYYYEDTHLTNVQPHQHDYYEFYFFRQGEITMYINDQPHMLIPGDVVLILPDTPHYIVNRKESAPYKRFVFWISKAYYSRMVSAASEFGYIISHSEHARKSVYRFDAPHFNTLQAIILRCLEEMHISFFGKQVKLALNIDNLLLTLNRLAYEQNHPGHSNSNLQLYEALMLYIDTHIRDDLSLDRLAEALFVSKYHIAHSFKENLGISVHSYIIKKRLSLCCDALLNQENIGEIYLEYGFKDYSSFYRAFKKEYGLSPQEYKKQHQMK